MSVSEDANRVPEVTLDDQEEEYLRRMYAIHDRDRIQIVSVKLESRTLCPAVPEAGLIASETFVFVVTFDNFGRRSARFTIKMTEELSLALVPEDPEYSDMLVAALSELASLGDDLHQEASRRGLAWQRFGWRRDARRARLEAGSQENEAPDP